MAGTLRPTLGTLALALLAAAVIGGPGTALAEDPGWGTVRLTGGPAHDIAVSPVVRKALPYDELTQIVFAAGTEVLTLERGADWAPRPGTGPMDNVAAGPAGTAFAAAADGLAYRTRDAGKTWSRVTVRQGQAVRFLAVSPDYAFDRSAYALTTSDWKLYQTSNDGATWQEVKVEVDTEYENAAVAYSPLHHFDETAFVATSLGVYKWSRDVRRWTLMSKLGGDTPAFGSAGGPAASQGLVLPFEYGDDPDRRHDPDLRVVFAYNAGGVYRSDDDGATWSTLALPAEVQQVNGLAVSNGWPRDPVLAVAVRAPGAVGYVSADNGRSWRAVLGRDGLVGTAVAMAVDFSPVPHPDRNWRGTVYLPGLYRRAAIDTRPTVVPPYMGSRELFLATDGDGVYRSTDAGLTWEPVPPSFTNVQVTALAFLPAAGGAQVLAGTATSGVYRSTDGGRSWRFTDSGLPRGAGQDVRALRVSPDFQRDRTVFLAAASGVWVSRDGGATWSRSPGPERPRTLAVSPAYATDRTVLCDGYLSADGGATWQLLPGADAHPWSAAAFSPDYATDRGIWWGTDDVSLEQRYGLRRWRETAGAWEPIERNEVMREAVVALSAIRVDLAEPPRIFAGLHRGLQQSFDDGVTWQRAGPQVGPTRDVHAHVVTRPYAGGIILAAAAEGALWSTSRGAAWTRDPRSPRDARSAAVSPDGRTFVVALPASVAAYDLPEGQLDLAAPWWP